MAILISPSNNTGWGLGTGSMYGGARVRSDAHPVKVRAHYRAPWGSLKGRVPRSRAPAAAPVIDPDDPVAATIEEVVAEARNYADRQRRRARRGRPRRSAAQASGDAVRRRVRNLRAQVRRARSRRAAAAAASAAISAAAPRRRGRRRNVYWVRDAVTGQRVPVTGRRAAASHGGVVV